MEARRHLTILSCVDPLPLVTLSLLIYLITIANADVSNFPRKQRALKSYRPFYDKDIDILATYSDASGAVKIGRTKMSHLSASWILENPADGDNGLPNSSQNVDRTLWKLGTLPPGLITFYNLTYPLDRSWHVLGLGYDPALNLTEIDNGAVVHYNGNNKPWLDLAVSKYKSYWSKYVMYDNYYLRNCDFRE